MTAVGFLLPDDSGWQDLGDTSAVGSEAARGVGWRRGFELGWGGARGTALRLGGLRCAKHRLARVAHSGMVAPERAGLAVRAFGGAESPSLA